MSSSPTISRTMHDELLQTIATCLASPPPKVLACGDVYDHRFRHFFRQTMDLKKSDASLDEIKHIRGYYVDDDTSSVIVADFNNNGLFADMKVNDTSLLIAPDGTHVVRTSLTWRLLCDKFW